MPPDGRRNHPAPAANRSIGGRVRALVGHRIGDVLSLAVASVLAGLSESGILAVLAQTATALVDRTSRVHLVLGPLHITERVGALLVIGLVLTLVRLSLQLVIAAVPARIVADMQARLRQEVFAAFTRAAWTEQSRDREGHFQELMTNQVTQALQTTVNAATIVVALVAFLVLVGAAVVLNPVASLIVLVASWGLFAILRPLSGLASRYGRDLSLQSLDYAAGINETVRVAEEAHVFGARAPQRERNDALIAPLSRSFFMGTFLARLGPGLYQGLIYLLVVAALAVLYLSGSAHVASLTAVILLLVRAGMYGQQAQAGYTMLRQALPYLDRVEDAQRRYLASIPAPGTRRLDEVRSLAFRGASYAYEPSRAALSDVELEIAAGDTIGVVGPSGAGKSTLVQLLLRLRAPDVGEYLINGIPASEFSQHDWHRQFAYVPQDPRLLHASVADNIRFFRDFDDAAVERAARLAGIHDDVMAWTAGYETTIGPRADAISGGQQQRICLARALVGEPAVLVLDEPTSALDPNSEALIQASLAALRHEFTLFVVAHRMSTLDICERVIVVVDGRVEACETPEVLVTKSAYYRSVTTIAQPAARLSDREA